MKIIELKTNVNERWNAFLSNFEYNHPLNAHGWGSVRSIDGWNPSYLIVEDEKGLVRGGMMILIKSIPWTGFSLMYSPKGPICDPFDVEVIQKFSDYFKELGGKSRCIFLRIDPNFHENVYKNNKDPFLECGYIHLEHRWSFWNSPRDVYRIDLTKASTTDELFNTLDRDARRCVRKAEKEGVTIRAAQSIEELIEFYNIFSGFTVKKGFMCRQLEYQKSLWRNFVEKDNGRLFLAVYKDKIIGGLICISFGGKCLAMHMGTPPEYNKLQTYYAYVWESMRWAKENNFSWYSFRGVGTTPTQESFKRKFGPEVYSLIGYYDLPLRPFLYKIFYFLEFIVLPYTWKYLMKLRQFYKNIFNVKGGTKG